MFFRVVNALLLFFVAEGPQYDKSSTVPVTPPEGSILLDVTKIVKVAAVLRFLELISFVFVPEKGHLRHLRRNLCGDLSGQLFRDTVRDGVGVASGHALHYVGGPQTKCLCELP